MRCGEALLYDKSNILVQGLVITDWEALDRLTDPHGSDYRQSIKSTINAGIDMVGSKQCLKPKFAAV